MRAQAQGSARYVALSGGVGGAKLSLGLAHLLGEHLTVIVNTGDDFEHLGLAISPDVDTALYTLAGLSNKELGWGRADESWNFSSWNIRVQSRTGDTSARKEVLARTVPLIKLI